MPSFNSQYLAPVQRTLRSVACLLVPPFLVLISGVVLIAQFAEIRNRNEILSFTSFIVILSFSALAFNWCRVTPNFAAEAILKSIYRAGIDFFLASMLALIATCLAWFRTLPLPAGFFAGNLSDASFYRILFWMHWTFLCFALLLTLGAILSMILAIGQSDEQQ